MRNMRDKDLTSAQSENRLVVVIVLYEMLLSQSTTYQTFITAYDCATNPFENLDLIIYDNSLSAGGMNIKHLLLPITYIHDPSNGGIASAYNYALNEAIHNGSNWLLLLDQDSTLPTDFLDKTAEELEIVESVSSVVAIVPKVRSDRGEMLSPGKLLPGRFVVRISPEFTGLYDKRISAINSGALIRVDFLKSIGGFNSKFKLDFLDHWLFYEIYKHGMYVCISSASIIHQLSVSNHNLFMTEQRYKNILEAEMIFMKSYTTTVDKLLYALRLIIRALKQVLTVKNKVYSKMTIKVFAKFVTERHL